MTRTILIAGTVIALAAFLIVAKVPLTQAQRLNAQCKDFGNAVIAENKDLFDGNSAISFFYSKRLDTCVKQEIDELGNEYGLCDIKRNYIKQELGDISICGGIFYCDKDGVDNVILAKAEANNGNLFHLSYSEFLDNGEGGEPRTLKTPESPYSREQCQLLFNQKLTEIE